jgi:hypothetical protein
VSLAPGIFDNPRAVAVGPGGIVSVADTGDPADPSSGRIIRVDRDGTTTSLLDGILNYVGSDDEFGQAHLHGLSDIAEHKNELYFVLGEEAWISEPLLGPNRLVRRHATGEITSVFDFGLFEQDHDPDGGGPESNATGVAVAPDGTLWVDDAAGNWLARLDASGAVSAVSTFPEVDGEDPVPTGIAVGPDGSAYVALFRCQSPTVGKGGVAKIRSDGGYEIVVAGLSNPIDIAFDDSGAMYVLEFSVDYSPTSGRLLRINDSGHTEVVLDGLNYPTSLAIDNRGGMYITSIASPSGGEAGTGALLYYRPIE